MRREYEMSADGAPLAVLAGTRREGCEFTLSGTGFRIERDGRKRFLLHGPDGRVAVADRTTGREWRVQATSGDLTLAKPSLWRSDWEVRGTTTGTIRRERWFKPVYQADVPADVPLPVGVFAFYVVLMILERQAAVAAAAS